MTVKKLWGGRFSGQADTLAEQFNSSIKVDQVLLKEDIAGSIAHSRMLLKIGLLTHSEQELIENGLCEVEKKFLSEPETFSEELEDIHMNVEHQLTELIGNTAKKLHTARSRNDQVALDFKLYVMNQQDLLTENLHDLIEVILIRAQEHKSTLMPGYTHLQRAQPITLGYHLLTYVAMFMRDVERLQEGKKRCSALPLGSGAIAGVPYETDREFLRECLGFEKIALHAMDAVSDRDFAIEFLSAASLIQTHLSRLAEEIVLWSSQEFGFIRLADAYCTGSSLMPQKRNPDIAELIRGKTGRVIGNLVNLLVTLKALPLAYNKDLQEDKAPVIDTSEQLLASIELMARMLETAVFNETKMKEAVSKGFLNATDLADHFVALGVPFRLAHEAAGESVKEAELLGIGLEGLDLEQYENILKSVIPGWEGILTEDLYQAIDPYSSIEKKKSPGSTSPEEIQKLLQLYQEWNKTQKNKTQGKGGAKALQGE